MYTKNARHILKVGRYKHTMLLHCGITTDYHVYKDCSIIVSESPGITKHSSSDSQYRKNTNSLITFGLENNFVNK
jgi:hypothetical protein